MRLYREFDAARYLVKPFAIGEIRQVVENVLGSRKFGQGVLVSDCNYQ